MSIQPKANKNVLEYAYDFVMKLQKEILVNITWRDYSLFLLFFFSFFLVANNIGLMAKLSNQQFTIWTSPTTWPTFSYDFAFSFWSPWSPM